MEIIQFNLIKSIIILLVVLLYWKFIYYKYHEEDYTPFSFFSFGAILFFIGLYEFIRSNVIYSNITLIYGACLIFLVISFSLVIYGIKKRGLNKKVDITLTWTKKVFPFVPFWFWMIIAFPALFFIMLATYYLLGPEHIIFWAMVFLAWIASNVRLIRKILLTNSSKRHI